MLICNSLFAHKIPPSSLLVFVEQEKSMSNNTMDEPRSAQNSKKIVMNDQHTLETEVCHCLLQYLCKCFIKYTHKTATKTIKNR